MRLRAFLYVAALFIFAVSSFSQTISWDGGGDGTTWSDPLNWAGNLVPGPTNDVVINVVGTPVIQHTTGNTRVRSLQCEESFRITGGTFTLTNGVSYVNGTFTVNPGRSFSVSNSITAFTANGPATISSANLFALNGAQMILAQATNYADNGSADYTIRAEGVGAKIDLSGVTNLTGIANASHEIFIEALSGGQVILSNVANFPAGAIDVLANGAGSLVDLASLTNFTGYLFFAYTGLEAINGGSINIPNLARLADVNVRLDATGTMQTTQMQYMTNSSIRADGAGLSFAGLTNLTSSSVILTNGGTAAFPIAANINGSSFDVASGVTLSFPAAQNYVHTGGDRSFRVRGAGTALDLSALTNVTARPGPDDLFIECYNGGTINMSNVVQFPGGSIDILATGVGSQVDLASLTTFLGHNFFSYTGLEATNGGAINIPNLTTLSAVNLRPWSSGSMQTAQMRIMTNGGSVLASGWLVDLGGVTNLSGTWITATNGGTLNLTNAINIDGASFFIGSGVTQALPSARSYRNMAGDHYIVAHGTGTVLDMSSVTNLAGAPGPDDLFIRALAGGTILLQNTLQISPAGSVDIRADGAGSIVDLSSVTTFLGHNFFSYTGLEAINGGTILVPSLRILNEVNVRPSTSGTLQTSQIHVFTNSTIVVDGFALNFSGVTNFSKSTVTLTNGGTINLNSAVNINGASFDVSGVTLSLPSARNYVHQGGGDRFFRARNGGTINLSTLTNLTSINGPDNLVIQATTGGVIDLSNVLQFPFGAIDVRASGPGSIVKLDSLTTFLADNFFTYSGLESTNGGTINIPSLVNMSEVNLRPWSNGVMQITQIAIMTNGCTVLADGFPIDLSGVTNLSGSTVTLTNGGTVNFTNVQDLDGGSLFVGNGATLAFPSATSYFRGNSGGTVRMVVHGTNSLLDFSGFTAFSSSPLNGQPFQIEAWAGGQVLLNNVRNFPRGAIDFLANGSNSFINLASLTNFIGHNSFSFTGLEVTNHASILLNSNAVMLTNVTVNVAQNGMLSSGPITLAGTSSFSGLGTWDLDIFTPPQGLSSTGVMGTATLSGKLNIDLPTAYTPPANTNYVIMLGGTRSGNFSTFTYPTNRLTMQLNYFSNRVEVQIVNAPPIVLSIPDQTIDEEVFYSYIVDAQDEPGQSLVFSLIGTVPDGMTIDSETGEITWTPTEEQGPSTNTITVVATDTGPGSLSHTNSYTLYVNEVHHEPQIVDPPDSQTVREGHITLFSVSAIGAEPLFYQWQFNGVDISGATLTNLLMFNTQLTQAGDYTVVVTNHEGSVTSSIAVLTVLEATPPSITINAPLAGERLFSTPATVSGTASDNIQVSNVQVRLNGSLFQTIGLSSNEAFVNWSTSVSPRAGTNTVQARAIDWVQNVSTIQTRTFFFVVTNQLTLQTNGNGSIVSYPNTFGGIGTPTNQAWLEVGRPYTIEAVPAAMHRFTNWTRVSNSVTTIYSTNALLDFVMETNLTLAANFVPAPPITYAGLYSGLFYETNAFESNGYESNGYESNGYESNGYESSGYETIGAETNGVAHHSAGFFTMRVKTNFVFSGKLLFDGDALRVSGRFNTNNGTFSKTISRVKIGKDDVYLNLQLDLSNGSDTVTGTLSNANWMSTLLADRATFSRTNPAVNYLGSYTMVIPGFTNAANGPRGFGSGTIVVMTNGTVKFYCTMADGRRTVQAVPLSKNGQWPFCLRLYKLIEHQTNLLTLAVKTNAIHFNGLAMGWLTFTNTVTLNTAPQGVVKWIKTEADPNDPFYPNGFTRETAVISSKFIRPPAGGRVLDLTNGIVTLSAGNLTTSITNTFVLGSNSVSRVTTEIDPVRMLFLKHNGAVVVTFDHPDDGDDRPVAVKGVVLQEQNFAAGSFKGTNAGGRMLILPE
jgi:hypothetical protein